MEVEIDNIKYVLVRSKLKKWIELEAIRDKIRQYSESGLAMNFCGAIIEYVSTCLNISTETIENAPWIDIIDVFSLSIKENSINKNLPIYKVKSLNNKKNVWEYEGRTWYFWIHNLAKSYGWSIEYIAELDVDDASALLEEIYVDDQLEKEFVWMTSEIAYPYNSTSKKSEFKPLPRPGFMMDEVVMIKRVEQLQHTKIPISMLPIGAVVKLPVPEDKNVAH